MPSLRRMPSSPMFAVLAVCALAQSGHAQTSPPTVTFVVSFAAGGIADVVARLVAQRLGERGGPRAVVENRGGAGGNLAARVVAAAAPDGSTILATTTALAVNAAASRNKGYATEDLRAVAIVASSPDVMIVHPSNRAADLRAFIAGVGDKSFTFGSPGLGTSPYIAAEYFFREVAKINSVHVPFNGGAPAVAAAIGNHVDLVAVALPTASAQIEQGTLRGIGLASPTRNAFLPNVPTYGEAGFADFYSATWVGFFAPARTPDAVVTKLNADINDILRESEAQQKLKVVGFDPMIKTAGEAADYFAGEVASWGRMSRAIGFTME